MTLEGIAAALERDCREPDKVLLYAASLRRSAFDQAQADVEAHDGLIAEREDKERWRHRAERAESALKALPDTVAAYLLNDRRDLVHVDGEDFQWEAIREALLAARESWELHP